jgi:hypothetical protein
MENNVGFPHRIQFLLLGYLIEAKASRPIIGILAKDGLPSDAIPSLPAPRGAIGIDACRTGRPAAQRDGENIAFEGPIGFKDQVKTVAMLGAIAKHGLFSTLPATIRCLRPKISKAIAQELGALFGGFGGEKMANSRNPN